MAATAAGEQLFGPYFVRWEALKKAEELRATGHLAEVIGGFGRWHVRAWRDRRGELRNSNRFLAVLLPAVAAQVVSATSLPAERILVTLEPDSELRCRSDFRRAGHDRSAAFSDRPAAGRWRRSHWRKYLWGDRDRLLEPLMGWNANAGLEMTAMVRTTVRMRTSTPWPTPTTGSPGQLALIIEIIAAVCPDRRFRRWSLLSEPMKLIQWNVPRRPAQESTWLRIVSTWKMEFVQDLS